MPYPPVPTPARPVHFDYTRTARDAKLSDTELRALITLFETDYPDDLLLRELHILRACNAINRGLTTIGKVLGQSSAKAA